MNDYIILIDDIKVRTVTIRNDREYMMWYKWAAKIAHGKPFSIHSMCHKVVHSDRTPYNELFCNYGAYKYNPYND